MSIVEQDPALKNYQHGFVAGGNTNKKCNNNYEFCDQGGGIGMCCKQGQCASFKGKKSGWCVVPDKENYIESYIEGYANTSSKCNWVFIAMIFFAVLSFILIVVMIKIKNY